MSDLVRWARPDRVQFLALLDALASDVEDLRHGLPDRARDNGKRWSLTAEQLFDRAMARPRETVPASDGRRPVGSHSAPTETAAVTFDSAEMVALRQLVTHIRSALGYLDDAAKVLDRATPENQRPDRPVLDCCRVCSRPGKPEPIYRSERCRWCYDFWLMWRNDVPEPILKMRREGRRISESDIRTELDIELLAG